jgi:hypothetical protein
MVWALYFPVILVVVVAIAAGIAILVRKIRGTEENPYIETGERDKETK